MCLGDPVRAAQSRSKGAATAKRSTLMIACGDQTCLADVFREQVLGVKTAFLERLRSSLSSEHERGQELFVGGIIR